MKIVFEDYWEESNIGFVKYSLINNNYLPIFEIWKSEGEKLEWHISIYNFIMQEIICDLYNENYQDKRFFSTEDAKNYIDAFIIKYKK